jgi:alkanesulfonate monooxygenase SsuD/methylene tetrahydromethanopterin reductase-like flavin-dependent oxidoreductase (luciferase family)
VLPQPPRGSIPVWLGGNGAGAQRRAGQLADGWCPFGLSPAQLRSGWDGVRAAAERAGRDPSSIVCAAWLPVVLTARGEAAPPGVELAGPPAQLIDRLAEYARAGLQHLLMANFCPPEAVGEQLAQIGEQVAPAVAPLGAPA